MEQIYSSLVIIHLVMFVERKVACIILVWGNNDTGVFYAIKGIMNRVMYQGILEEHLISSVKKLNLRILMNDESLNNTNPKHTV